MINTLLLSVMLIAPFAGSLLVSILPLNARRTTSILASLVTVIGLCCAIMLYPSVVDGGVRYDLEWLPTLGLDIVLRLDGLSWTFVMLILGIGALVILYAHYYMSPQDPVPRFFSYFLGFMGAMLGIVMSGNLIQLVIFWELTSLLSFLLIGYWHHNASARDGARMALTVTATGGLCLLVGVITLGHIVGSFDLDVVLASGDTIRNHALYTPMLVLVLIGALSKSAQFPFGFWLPHAMAAPTPVSAYLHSATMVKAGVFLLIRLWPVLAGTDIWVILVGGAGLITLVIGAYKAIFQHDLKGLLAYSTISHLGLITLLLGMGSPLALVAAIFHTLNHATFKASLFMAAGIIDHETGTRDMRKLSGLFRFMPHTATLAMVAAAAMAGVPLLNGFLSKEMFLAETVAHENITLFGNYALPALATLASAFAVLYSLRFIHKTFFGAAPTELTIQPHDSKRLMRFPMELLVLTCLVVGIFPENTIGPFLDLAVGSVLGSDMPSYSLAVWHGVSPALMMSLVALAAGTILYVMFRHVINDNTRGAPLIYRWRGQQAMEAVISTITLIAQWIEKLVSTRRLQTQLRLIFIVILLLSFFILTARGWENVRDMISGASVVLPDPAFALLWVIGCVCAIVAAYQAKHHRIFALILLGGAGLVSCITFAWLSAPDLAITQLLVEIVAAVLLVLGLRWLPERASKPTMSPLRFIRMLSRRGGDITIAAAMGAGMALLSYSIMVRPAPDRSLSHFFLEKAYSEAGGLNVVNVLLVDFRAFDTLAEITVLGIVGLTIFALLRRFRPAAESLQQPDQQRIQNAYDQKRVDREIGATLNDYMFVPRLVMQWLFPVITVLTIFLFLRGHDLPGGGFAAGVAMSIALILQYIAFGVRWVEARLTILPIYWIGVGLLLAVLTGVGSLVFGYPFLTSHFQYLEIPILGSIPLATALLFDLGVFILVVGATTLILIAIAHQSLRKPRVVAVEIEAEPIDEDALPAPAPAPEVAAEVEAGAEKEPEATTNTQEDAGGKG